MEKILITDNSYSVASRVKEIQEDCGDLKHVTLFFERRNFILKKYHLLSSGVHMVLEFEEKEVQIESANCGYCGGGPTASVEVLTMLGLEKRIVEELVFCYDALDFDVNNRVIGNVDTSLLFYPATKYDERDKSFYNKIEISSDISIDLEKRKVWVYNPQRNFWNGFLNLLSYMDDIQMEYYIGPNSPLEGGVCIGNGFNRELKWGPDKPDIKGTEHVNLCLTGSNFTIVCFIDREYEKLVIDAIYLSLTGESLFLETSYAKELGRGTIFRELFRLLRTKKQEIYNVISIDKKQMGISRR